MVREGLPGKVMCEQSCFKEGLAVGSLLTRKMTLPVASIHREPLFYYKGQLWQARVNLVILDRV